MDTLLGLAELVVIGWVVSRLWRRPGLRAQPRPATTAGQPEATGCDDPDAAEPIAGWLLGHQLAHGDSGFPGDPLPDGHLGSPSSLAFWSGFGDEGCDERDLD